MLNFIGYIGIIGTIRIVTYLRCKSNKFFVTFSLFILFLICAFRSIYFGPDVLGYVSKYISLSSTSISTYWEEFTKGIGKDPIFYLLSKVINMLGASYQSWLAIIAAVFCFACYKLIKKYSDEPFLSIVILLSLGYLYFSLTGLRQTIALSIVMLSYKYLRDRKFLPFVVLVLLSSLFHSTSIIFITAYFFSNMKLGWKQVVGIIGSLILAYFFKEEILIFLGNVNTNERYSYYIEHGTTLTISGFIIHLCIYLFCIIYKKDVIKNDRKNLSLYNFLFLGLIFEAFSLIIAEFFRIAMYFNIFSIIIIPKVISAEKNEQIKIIIYLSVLLALIAYLFWSRVYRDFRFCWQ